MPSMWDWFDGLADALAHSNNQFYRIPEASNGVYSDSLPLGGAASIGGSRMWNAGPTDPKMIMNKYTRPKTDDKMPNADPGYKRSNKFSDTEYQSGQQWNVGDHDEEVGNIPQKGFIRGD